MVRRFAFGRPTSIEQADSLVQTASPSTASTSRLASANCSRTLQRKRLHRSKSFATPSSLVSARSRAAFFIMDPFIRKLKFRRYTLRAAQLDRACFELAGARRTNAVVGFGHCGMAGEGLIKRSVAGPVKAFACKLARSWWWTNSGQAKSTSTVKQRTTLRINASCASVETALSARFPCTKCCTACGSTADVVSQSTET
ncbi:hypothetical protein F443_08773 [Phytophthora nicotianae P1569]|uniref:Uncharacterized protein n=1 Tax=Phytophthora nicotianae P1569 TaxID=1317065 RepID=V9F952_PHYNI|nr:hypothetical protein F443_08773 [Phytophthora nicotianae P1569]